MNPRKTVSFSHDSGGFSLVELLVVVVIVGMLAVLVAPSLGNLASTGRDTQAMVQISSALERAREYAVSRNTYTWVAFRGDTTNGKRTVTMGIIGSADGSAGGINMASNSSVSVASSAGSLSGTNRLALLDKITRLEDCVLQEKLPSESRMNDGLSANNKFDGPNSAALSKKLSFAINYPGFSGSLTNSVMFTPEGEARISNSLVESVQIIVVPTQGDENGVRHDTAANAIRIYGLSGRVKAYRPGAGN